MRYSNCTLNRRDFIRAIGATTLGAGPVFACGRPLDPLSPGIKISFQIPGDFTAEDLVSLERKWFLHGPRLTHR